MAKIPNLTDNQKEKLHVLEPKMKASSLKHDYNECVKIYIEIRDLLLPTGHETRLMQTKNWLYETAMEVGKIQTAINGFNGIRKSTSKRTRIYLEATSLLAICYLRKSNLEKARPYMIEAFQCEGNIKSLNRRSEFKLSLARRFDQEALLVSLSSDEQSENLDIESIHNEAGEMLRTKREDQILEMLGANVPEAAIFFMEKVNAESKNLLSYEEKLRLPSPAAFKEKEKLGLGLFSAFKTVIWQSLCDKNSEVYKMWFTNGMQAVLDKKYITSAVVASMAGLSIGTYAIAVYISALLMKVGIEAFCLNYQPETLMELRK